MKYLALLLLSACTALCALAQQTVSKGLKDGDILMQRLPCGSLCQAIIETTPCAPDRQFNHCGILAHRNGTPVVIEAIGKAVQETPLDSFLRRDTAGQLTVARPKARYTDAQAAITKARSFLGVPYDAAFLPGDSALYCSELVWESFDEKGTGQPLFPLEPMTFISPKTKELYPAWEAYYDELGEAIPEGFPGINPCAIANSGFVELIVLRR